MTDIMELMTDKLSIKNLLFTKAIPNYTIPAPINGHKVYACTDCGDKFIFESSYNDHINRKSAKISYMCRYCSVQRVFYNRCNLLFHIRSHAFKSATINVTDLKVELLPLNCFKIKPALPAEPSTSSSKQTSGCDASRRPTCSPIFCYECKENITVTAIAYKDRARHFMQYTNEVFSCPICLFALPSLCALKVHIRLHVRAPPYYCPECGIHLANKNVQYPYNHDCEGFKMMRATARINCTVPNCCLFHPNDYKEHMKKYHLKKVFKCPYCVVACFSKITMDKHLKGHKTSCEPILFYQCDICPRRYVLQNPRLNDLHLKSHVSSTVFPCWACGSHFTEVSNLLTHFIKKHNKNDVLEVALNTILNEITMSSVKQKTIYRVVKRCDQCKRSFTYKCKYEEIQILPNECPFKCTSTLESNVTPERLRHYNELNITCHLCQISIPQDWAIIKKHYAELHKTHKCLDVEILLTRLDMKKYLSQKKIGSTKPNASKTMKISKRSKIRKQNLLSSSPSGKSPSKQLSEERELHACNMCGNHFDQKSTLEEHMITHRDPCMAYQCMECGQSFVVKPSFAKHLLLEHDIMDAENYINNKQCYNQNAHMTYQTDVEITEEPLGENQCKICREEFDDPEDLEKHFRVHGMAFLMKNTSNKNGTPS